jgi:hypothetical protein
MKRGMPVVVWVLLGLLGLSAFLLSLGQRDIEANPTTISYGPSGTSALAQLLRERGHPIRVDRRAKPKLETGDLALAFADYNPNPMRNEEDLETIGDSLRAHAERGGNVLLIEIPKDFQNVSRRLKNEGTVKVRDIGRKRDFQASVDTLPSATVRISVANVEHPSVTFWTAGDDREFVRAYRVGKGTVLVANGALGFTNRFIDQGDNAAACISLIDLLAKRPANSHIVFTEASFGNVDAPSLLDTLGAWAVASWYQVLFLAVVVIFTLGRRFGYAEVDPTKQRGTRELLDALSDTFMRGRHAQVALRIILARVESEIRAALRLGRDFEISARDERLSPELRKAMAEAYAALTMEKLRPNEALPIVRNLLKAKTDFVQGRRGTGRLVA